MLFYIGLYAIVFCSGYILKRKHNTKKNRKLFVIFSFAIMALVVGMRGNGVGEDTNMYLQMFDSANNVSWGDLFANILTRSNYGQGLYGYYESVESGFLVLCKLFHIITNEGHLFLLLVSSITYYLLGRFVLENTENVFLATMVVLCESTFMSSFNGMRQLLSVAIAIQAYSFLKKANIKKAILCITFAFIIHNTSIIAIVLFPIFCIPEEKKEKYFKYFVMGAVIMPSLITYFSEYIIRYFPRYQLYFSINYWENSLGGSFLLIIMELVLIVHLWHKKFVQSESFRLSILTLLFISLEIAGYKVTMFSRAALFFREFLLLLIPCGVSSFKGKNKQIIAGIIYVLLFAIYISCARSPARVYHLFF